MKEDAPEPIDGRIDEVFALVMTLDERRPAPELPRRLTALFKDLARPDPARPPGETLDLIWALWISHPDAEAAGSMAAAVEALAAEDFDTAAGILDGLVVRRPRWSEAWNKRATAHWLIGNFPASLADICETVKREPRHFGAYSGLGMIRAEMGENARAVAALELARKWNPHIVGIVGEIERLKALGTGEGGVADPLGCGRPST